MRVWSYRHVAMLMYIISVLSAGAAQLTLRSEENNSILNPNNVVVGVASDLAVLVRCSGNGTESITWEYGNGTEIPVVLQPFGISQGDVDRRGLLRVYPAEELMRERDYVCTDGNGSLLNVTFNPVVGLFFTSTVPLETNSATRPVTGLCSVPDIPDSRVTSMEQGNGTSSYCLVETERGVYRSVDIITILPSFRTEPSDILINGSSVAAFICSITNPGNRSIVFQWLFSPINSSDEDTLLVSRGDSNITILDSGSDMPLSDSGTSILILESVSGENEGMYFCEAGFDGEDFFNSSTANLTFIDNQNNDSEPIFVLRPNMSYVVPSGGNLVIPCLASNLALPTFILNGNITPVPDSMITTGGLNLVGVVTNAFYQCTIGTVTEAITITIEEETATTTVSIHSGPELMVVEGGEVDLTCTPPENSFLAINGSTSSTANSFNVASVSRNESGFYQCLSDAGAESADVVAVGSVYLLVTYLDTPIITSSSQAITLGLDPDPFFSCSTLGRPLPQLSWSISPQGASLEQTQFSTLLGEPAMSNLSISVCPLLNVGDYVVTCTADGVLATPTSSSVNLTVAVLFENVSITVTTSDVVLGSEPDTVTVVCTVEASLEPSFSFSRNGIGSEMPSVQMSEMNQYESNITYDISDFEIGTEIITCTLTLNVSNPPLSLVTNASINVGVVFENISILAPEMIILRDDNLFAMIVLNCTLESGVMPNIVWRRNDITIAGTTPTLLGGNTYVSMVTLNISSLLPPVEIFQCTGSLNITEDQFILDTNSTITIDAILRNVTISPEEQVFNISVSEKQSGNGTVVTLTCSLEASLLPDVVWNQDGVVLNGTAPVRPAGLDVQSELVVNVAEFRGVVSFTCTASVEVLELNISAMATITTYIFPEFTTDPIDLTLTVLGDLVTLSCTAVGFSIPTISWEDTEGAVITDDRTFNISSSADSASYSSTSSLSFIVSEGDNRTLNNSNFRCVATNIITDGTESEAGQLLIGGPPGQPPQFNATDLTSDNTTFIWSTPFSIFNITNYLLSIVQTNSDSSMNFTAIAGMVLAPDLRSVSISPPFLPVSRYRAALVAVSRAGNSEEAVVSFETLESIPGPPVNIRTSAPTLGQIIAEWDPTPLGMRNGNLIGYTVRYQLGSNSIESPIISSLMFALTGLNDGVTYMIQVAAHTRIGMGPYSVFIPQDTVSIPPDIPFVMFQQDTSRSVTTNSIPILLPDIADISSYSHFWVIAMKLNNGRLPENMFTNNQSFTLYSASIPIMVPYVVAEISASRYDAARMFTLGGGNSSFGDISLYVNGPLSTSTFYTVFVWGFSPVPPSGQQRVRRQTQQIRQYSAFASTPFLDPVSTAGVGLDGGAITGIVIALILLLVALVGVIVISVFLCDRFRYNSDMGPPPSRKGSMRLRDQNEIVRDTLRSSLRSSFRISSLRNLKAQEQLRDLNPDDARLPVPMDEFPDYVRTMHKNTDHLFSEEYEIITIKSPSLSHVQCSLPANVNKNRYANINCSDSSRIVLRDNKDVNSTDYINANYVNGYQVKCAYIASQGPLANTMHDFWRMIWEQDSSCIIMLTNLVEKSRVKCHQYWPEVGGMTMGDISINLIEIQELAYYTIRTFHVSKGNERREVKQFHYTGWPDFGVPDYPNPVIAFVKRISHFKRTTSGPDIVHCSAGVGRSGTLMAIQSMMQMMKEEEIIDIFNYVLGMRQQRNYMVQTERQYIFIHDTILEHIRIGNTEIKIQNLRRCYERLQAQDPKTDSSLMEKEYSRLDQLQVVDGTQFHPAQSSANLPKNRFQNILPYDRYRVRLLLHPGVNGSDYINASYVDGYQHRHQYILTQGPMNNTVNDFWRMVWEHRCSCIMMLCQLEEKGKEQSVCYWPVDKVHQHGDMFIEQTNMSQFNAYIMREFAITNTKINESRIIKHYHYSDWLEHRSPSNAADIIDLIGVLHKTQHMCGGGPIIVHDSTSTGRSGTFVILSSILEQLKVEGIVDPFSMIHSLRQQQPGLVSNFEQYRFCYKGVMEFLDSFDHYANFD